MSKPKGKELPNVGYLCSLPEGVRACIFSERCAHCGWEWVERTRRLQHLRRTGQKKLVIRRTVEVEQREIETEVVSYE